MSWSLSKIVYIVNFTLLLENLSTHKGIDRYLFYTILSVCSTTFKKGKSHAMTFTHLVDARPFINKVPAMDLPFLCSKKVFLLNILACISFGCNGHKYDFRITILSSRCIYIQLKVPWELRPFHVNLIFLLKVLGSGLGGDCE